MLIRGKWEPKDGDGKSLPLQQIRILNYSGLCRGGYSGISLLLLLTSFSALARALDSKGGEFSPGETTFTGSLLDSPKPFLTLKSAQGAPRLPLSPLYTDNPPPSESKFRPNGQFVRAETVIGSSPEPTLIPDQQTSFYDFPHISQSGGTGPNGDSPSPPSTSLPPPAGRASDKPLNINLVRKLQVWSSSRSSKLNLTSEHESLLRVEPTSRPPSQIEMSPTMSGAGMKLLGRTSPVTPGRTGLNSIRPRTLPTPASGFRKSRARARIPYLYPEWLSASGGVYPDEGNRNRTPAIYPDYETESLEAGTAGNLGERFEESPRREQRLPQRLEAGEDAPESSGYADGKPPPVPPPVADQSSGLADVISRGRIDSVMYVYFGDKFNDYHKEEIAGRIIQAVGGVVAAIAQVLTVLGAAKCIRKGNPVNILPVHLHIGFALLISNLLLLLAVHATEPLDVCASVAVILHYLHLVIGAWLLAHTVQTYRALRHHVTAPNLLHPDTEARSELFAYERGSPVASSTLTYCALTWAVPFPFIMLSYLASPDGYETRRYCWMSIEKGMVLSFIVPVFLLIGLNTMLVIMSLRHLLALRKLWEDPLSGDGDEDMLDEKAVNSGIRASAMLLPLLAVMWFLGVVALENPTSVFFQLTAAVASIALSWLVMYFIGEEAWPESWCPFSRKDPPNLSSAIEESSGGPGPSVQPSGAVQLPFDSEPLLASTSAASQAGTSAGPTPSTSAKSSLRWPHKNRPNWSRPGGNEIYELRHDAISTIYK